MRTRIKEYRARYNMTQEELARRVGVRRETIVFLEKGKYNPSLKLAYRIAKVFGTTIEDIELSRAAKRLIITTEKIIPHEDIIDHPDRTAIPHFVVDAVVESRYGSHPGNMPDLYYSDEEHMAEWLKLSRSDEGVQEYMDKYVFGVENQAEYIELIGGEEKMKYLWRLEHLQVPMEAPWRR